MDKLNETNKATSVDSNRRDFIKKAAYSTPAIVTMAAIPSFASAGSGYTPTTPREHRRNRASDNNV